MNRHRWVLLSLGVSILICVASIARLGDLGQRTGPMLLLWGAAHALYLVAAWWVLRGGTSAPRPSAVPIILLVGLLARAFMIPAAPTLSEDIYRYLWDGRLVAHGVNPFPHAPSDPALLRYHSELIHQLNHAGVPTIYPPAAQILFGAVALFSATPLAWKLALLGLEFILLVALLDLLRRRELPGERLLLYYWNPLVLVESFGSGHVDLAAAAFLVATVALYERKRTMWAGVSFALAVLTKYVPAMIIPWLIRRRAWLLRGAAAAAAAILAAPFLGAGPALTTGLRIYARHWEFNGALYHLLREAIASEVQIRYILAGAGVVAMLAIAWWARSASTTAFASAVAFLLLSPTVFPWYAVPVVAFLPLHPDWGMAAFSGLLALSYLPLPLYRETGVWALPGWVLWVEYGGLIGAWALAFTWQLTRAARARRQDRAWACTSESTPT
jgi:alpha-1,6-mannosyltransferase